MAQLVLVPNPVVMAVQAGVFLANVVVIKKLLLEPYLTVRDRRDRLTEGNRDEAVSAITKCEAVEKEISQKLVAAAHSAQRTREGVRVTAVEKRNALLATAESEARGIIDRMSDDVRRSLEAERAKVPQVVQQLTQQVFQLAVE